MRRRDQSAHYVVKRRSVQELITIINERRTWGMRVGLVAGVFDLIHMGHLHLADLAVDAVDLVVVAVYTDRLARELRGEKRPTQALEDRMVVLDAFWWSDYVIELDQTVVQLIRQLCPHFYLTGDDHPEEAPSAEGCREAGCELRVIPCLPGYSTTTIIERIAGEKDGTS